LLEIIIKSFKDLFDRKILLTSLIPIIIAAILWGIIFFIFHTKINQFVVYLVSHIPFIGNNSWVQSVVEAIGGIFIYYELLIITSVMIVGIIADSIVDRINSKYYNIEKKGFGTILESIFIALKQNLIFFILFIIFLPAMFIPLLNIFVHIFLWSILIKKPTFYDSISMYATKEEFKFLQNSNKMTIIIITFFCASFFLIPIFGIFVYIIQLLIFTHFNLQRLKELR
jgi:CysZ protein